jgi:hypothetical protein
MLMTQVDRTLEIEKKFLGIALTVHWSTEFSLLPSCTNTKPFPIVHRTSRYSKIRLAHVPDIGTNLK